MHHTQFLEHIGFLVQGAKSCITIYGRNNAEPLGFQWHCGDIPLPCVPSARYLGLFLNSVGGLLGTCEHLLRQFWASWAILRRQYAGLQAADSVCLLLQVYKACVPPAGSYACELWAPRSMARGHEAARTRLGNAHTRVLRTITGLRRSTPQCIVLSEVGQNVHAHTVVASGCRVLESLGLPASGCSSSPCCNCRLS